MTPQKDQVGAIVCDFLLGAGGAERVAINLAEHFSSDLYCGFKQDGVRALMESAQISSFRDLGFNGRNSAIKAYRLIRGFERQQTIPDHYSWLIYSGNFAPLAVSGHRDAKNIFYCHTPPRFIYDLKDDYEKRYPGVQLPFLRALVAFLGPKYESACGLMDVIVANSSNTQNRIKRYLNMDSVVVYPPCPVSDRSWKGQDDFYLSTARLEPYKRVDRVIEAFKQMPDKKLLVTSGGREEVVLKRLATGYGNISFTGWVSENKMKDLLGRAIATIYIPKEEDFGMSPVESMACGKPVIGVREGGLLETIIDGETGILLESDPSIESIVAGVQILTPKRAMEMRHSCEDRSILFSEKAFYSSIRRLLENE